MKEKDFQNCRSAKKITQLRQVLKSNGSATTVVAYIPHQKVLYKRYYMFNNAFSLFVFVNFMLKSSPIILDHPTLCHGHFVRMLLKDGASLGAYFVNKLALPFVDFKMNVIKWKLHFVSCNFGLKSNL